MIGFASLLMVIGATTAADSLFILEASDPVRDQECVFHADCSYTGGDLAGARLTLREIPVARSDKTSGGHPPVVYAPVSVEIDLDRTLKGGETQLVVFVSLPPLYLEHVVVRNSLSRREPDGNDILILLGGQKEFSFITGLDPELDEAVETFHASGDYKNCFFSAGTGTTDAWRSAGDFNVLSGGKYVFPPSPFYWKEIPEMKIGVSLEVRESAEGTPEVIAHLISDSLNSLCDSARVPPNDRRPSGPSSYPLEAERASPR